MLRSSTIRLLVYALVGWVGCAAVMGVGQAFLPLRTALIVHAVAAPLIFTPLAFSYFRRFPGTDPLRIAAITIILVMALDFFVVALLVLHSLDMFRSVLGTWLPFVLIFLATYLTGRAVQARQGRRSIGSNH